MLLQFLIITSGNYNFFNLLTIFLCLSLVDDRHLYGSNTKPSKTSTIEKLITGVSIALMIYWTGIYFAIELGKEVPVDSKTSKFMNAVLISRNNPKTIFLDFSFQEFEAFLKNAVPISIAIGAISFGTTALSSLYQLVFKSKSSLLTYIVNVIKFVPYFIAAVFLFGISLVRVS